jgi:hypothetical protein
VFPGTDQRPTGVYALTDPFGYGFEPFQPGPGTVYILLAAQWTPEPSGFAGLHVSLMSQARNAITWSAA